MSKGKEGLWFSLPTTTEKLQEALREIGISADNPQDFFLYDYRSPQERPIKLPRDLMLSADVDELNFLAARLEKLDAAELSELNAALTSPAERLPQYRPDHRLPRQRGLLCTSAGCHRHGASWVTTI